MQGLDWEFVVIDRPDPNAMVLPGGKVIVHTGLLDLMETKDELAAVLGHETAHVLARHVVSLTTFYHISIIYNTIALLGCW